MSDTRYFQQLLSDFIAKHPSADGWKVYHYDPFCHSIRHGLLPAYLRERAPKTLLREEFTTTLLWEPDKHCLRRSITIPPCVREGPGIVEQTWFGEIDIDWNGRPIHYKKAYFFLEKFSHEHVVLIAAKGRTEIEELWNSLRAYERETFGSHTNTLEVIGRGTIERPRLDWTDLILPEKMLRAIRCDTESFLKSKERYAEMGLPYRRGFIFSGPPGCGKTLTTKVIAAQAKARVFVLPVKADLEDNYLNMAFSLAAAQSPSVLILEDLDRLVDSNRVSMSYLLNLLDGIDSKDGVLVVATTNAPEKLDAALLHRPSRFDKVWHFGLPGYEERRQLLMKKGGRRFTETSLENAAKTTKGFTMACVQEAVVNAMLTAVGEERPPQDEDLAMSVEDLKTQNRASMRASGALPVAERMGFAVGSHE